MYVFYKRGVVNRVMGAQRPNNKQPMYPRVGVPFQDACVMHAASDWVIPGAGQSEAVVRKAFWDGDDAPHCAAHPEKDPRYQPMVLERGLVSYVKQSDYQRFQGVEDYPVEVVKDIVAKTVEAQLKQRDIQLNQSPDHLKAVDELSDRELLAWRPQAEYAASQGQGVSALLPGPDQGHGVRRATRPAARSRQNPAPDPVNQGRVHIGSYQFTPFSFQAPTDEVQSVTTMSLPARTGLAGQNHRHRPEAAMMTVDPHVSYNASVHRVTNSQYRFQGGNMVDLSGYKDLTKPPASQNGEHASDGYAKETEYSTMSATSTSTYTSSGGYAGGTHPEINEADMEIYAEYSGNVKTLVQLVNDLPEGVTKQTGAQIIRLTMEAMGISMENVLSDAQAAQSQLLDAVRSNIKKIEEYKTVIRKLESEIRFHQGKANELSEIIDLFILSNTSPKMPNMERAEVNT